MNKSSIIKSLVLITGVVGALSGCKSKSENKESSILLLSQETKSESFCLKPDIRKANEQISPVSTRVEGHNLNLNNSVELVYYVSNSDETNIQSKGLLIWKNFREDGLYNLETAQYKLTNYTTNPVQTSRGEVMVDTYSFDGLAAKELSQYVYAVSYLFDGNNYIYSALDRYSVLDYYWNMEYSWDVTCVENGATLGDICDSIIEYGAMAQKYFGYNLDRLLNATYYYASTDMNCSFADGFRYANFTSSEEIKVVGSGCPEHYHLSTVYNQATQEYYEPKNNANFVTFKISQDVEYLIATYEENTITVTIDAYDDEGNLMEESAGIIDLAYGSSYNLFTNDSGFIGYRLVKFVDSNGNDFSSTGTCYLESDIELKAIFTKIKYTINFVSPDENLTLSYSSKTITIDDLNQYDLSRIPPVIMGAQGGLERITGWSYNDQIIANSYFELDVGFENAIFFVKNVPDVEITLTAVISNN